MSLVIFDVGGTLIDDPFVRVIDRMRNEGRAYLPLEAKGRSAFFDHWNRENRDFDFPFASHFAQEESWVVRSLNHVRSEQGVPEPRDIPMIAPAVLRRYRQLARKDLQAQRQLPLLRRLFKWLSSMGVVVCIGSNDRDWATRAMLDWVGLAPFVDRVFTSEGLSEKHPGAEKPNPKFFRAMLLELERSLEGWSKVVYVGDSEERDIKPAKALGITTVRYLGRPPYQSPWAHWSPRSVADYRVRDRSELQRTLQEILGQ